MLIAPFSNAWAAKEKELNSRQFQSGADSFQPLINATAAVNEAVIDACIDIGIDPQIVEWPQMENDMPTTIKEIIDVQQWLKKHGFILPSSTAENENSSNKDRG
jgi:hypothetical protein